ncbi:hypothetical protein HaLaN_25465 [Haematococcus lacustris]|uniref:Uncharacterized protein n=1 Tax=Haematococcus lacustris TaxID=44745 RepID=A0A699ZYN4_HAELA|nr:hypothetical protein HaLaN_25465 [Haematococcus lacustris]
MKRHGHAKQLVVLFGAASIGTRGGWGADAVLRACSKVVCRPRGAGQRRGMVVLVDEHRTTRVSSAVNGKQPCEGELDHEQPTRPADWKPPAGQVEQRLGKGKGKAAKAKPAPQPGRWIDRDCNAALNMQRIGEAKWRPLELCYWPDQGALPAKGKEWDDREALPATGNEYQQGYKLVNDRLPKGRQRLHWAAEYRRGVDGLAHTHP